LILVFVEHAADVQAALEELLIARTEVLPDLL
jgi:hypothetical protein